MNIATLLDHLGSSKKEELLRGILTHAFRSEGAELDIEVPVSHDLDTYLREKVTESIATAEIKIAEIEMVYAEDGELDDTIYGDFEEKASEVNNGGSTRQIQHLIVEEDWSAKQVNESASENRDDDEEG